MTEGRQPRLSEGYLRPGSALKSEPREDAPKPEKPAGNGFLARHRTALLAITSVVAVAAVAWGVFGLMRGPAPSYAVDRFASIIKLERGRRAQHGVTAVVSDPRWAERPAADRQRQIEALLHALQRDGIHSVTLLDHAGRPRATAVMISGRPVVNLE